MKNLNTLLLNEITKISKESRLVYDKKNAPRSTAPAPAPRTPARPTATPTTPATPEAAKDALKTKLAGNKATKLSKVDWSKVTGGVIGKVNKFIATASKNSAEAVKEIKGQLGSLEKLYKKLATGGFTADEIKQLNAQLIKINIEGAKTKAALEEAKKKYEAVKKTLTKKNIETAVKKYAKTRLKALGVPEPLLTQAADQMGSIASAKIYAALQGSFKVLEQLYKKGAAGIKDLNKALKDLPTTAQNLLEKLRKFGTIDDIINAQEEYLQAVKILAGGDKIFIDAKCSINGKECGKYMTAWRKKAAGLLKNMPKPDVLVKIVKEAQTKIIAAGMIDKIDVGLKAKLMAKLAAAGLVKGPKVKLTVELFLSVLMKFQQPYSSLQYSGAEKIQAAAKFIQSIIAKLGLKVKMEVKSGADSDAIQLSPGSKRHYDELQQTARRIVKLEKLPAGDQLRRVLEIPGVREHLVQIRDFAKASNTYEFLKKLNPGNRDKYYLGAGAALNVLLAVRRSENIAGNVGAKDSLYNNSGSVIKAAASRKFRRTQAEKRADRTASIGFVLDKKIKVSATGGVTIVTPPKPGKPSTTAGTTPAKPGTAQSKPGTTPGTKPSAATKSPTKAPAKPTSLATPATPEKGKTAIFNGVEYEIKNGKYKIPTVTNLLSKEEFQVYIGKEIPTQEFMKAHTKVSWLKEEPSTYSFDYKKKKITRTLGAGDSTITVTYKIGESIKISSNKGDEDISALLKDTSRETLKLALNAGLNIKGITAKNKIETAIKNGEYHVAIEVLVQEKPQNIGLITSCLYRMENVADINKINAAQLPKLKALLPQIIKNWPESEISTDAYEKFKTIFGNGSPKDLTGDKLLSALLEKDVDKAVIRDLVGVIKNQSNQKLLGYYLYKVDEAFDPKKKALNIELIVAYKGNDLEKKAAKFVIENYKEIEKKKKGRAVTLLKAHTESVSKTDDSFKKAYEILYKTPKLTGKNIPEKPETWVEYTKNVKDVNLLNTGIEKDTSDADTLKYLEALIKEKHDIEIPELKDDKILKLAKKFAALLKSSKNPEIKLIGFKLDAKIKEKDTSHKIESSETRGNALLKIVENKEIFYLTKIEAIDSLVSDKFSDFKGKERTRNEFIKKLKKLREKLNYREGNYGAIDTDYLSEARKKFVEIHESDKAPSAKDLNYLLNPKNIAVIGREKLIDLASKDEPLTALQKVKILKTFGLKAIVKTVIDSMDDDTPEKSLLEAQLAQSKDKLQKYKKAFDELGADTATEVKIQIFEGYYAQIQLLNKTNPRIAGEHEKALDESVSLKNLADKKLKDANTDAEKEAIIKAKLIRASIEKTQCTRGSSSCDVDELVTESKEWLDTQKIYDAKFVKGLKTAVEKSGGFDKLGDKAKKTYVSIMLKAAKQAKNPKDKAEFLKGIDAKKITDSKDKAAFLESQGKYLEAAKESEGKEKFRLLNLAARQKGVDKIKLADEYASIDKPEALKKKAQTQAAEIYVANKSWTKATEILKDADNVHKGVAAKLVTKFPKGQRAKAKEIADAHDLYDVQFSLFTENTDIGIDITSITSGLKTTDHGLKLDAVMKVLLKKRADSAKKVGGAKLDRIKFYETYYDKYIKDKSNEAELKKSIMENLGFKESDIATIKAETIKKRKEGVKKVYEKLGIPMNKDFILQIGADKLTFSNDAGQEGDDFWLDAKSENYYWKTHTNYKGYNIYFGVDVQDPHSLEVSDPKKVGNSGNVKHNTLKTVTLDALKKRIKEVKDAIDKKKK